MGQPSALKGPVPQTTEEDPFASLGGEAIPNIPAAAAAPVTDDPFASLQGEPLDATVPEEVAGADQEIQMSAMPEPEGLALVIEQFREGGTRLRNAFAVTDNESLDVLKQSGMFEDVKKSGDGLLVKRPGRKGWEKFDRNKIELIGDTLDFARDAFEGLIENAGRVGGGISSMLAAAPAGAVAGSPAGLLGAAAGGVATGLMNSVPGAIAGGAVGAAAAKTAGDFVAQDILGIPLDPTRDKVAETKMAAAFGATISGGMSMLGSRMARRAANIETKHVAAKQSIAAANERVAATIADVKEVAASGLKLGEDGKLFLDPQVLVGRGSIPEIDAMAKNLSTEPAVRNMREQLGDSLVKAYDGIAKSLGARAGRGSNLGDDFVLSAGETRKVEGEFIGELRKQAAVELKGVQQIAPRTAQNTLLALQKYTVNGKLDAGLVQKQLGLNSSQAGHFIEELTLLKNGLKKGNGAMSLETAFAKEALWTEQINKNITNPAGRAYAVELIEMRKLLREDSMDMMQDAYTKMSNGPGGKQLLDKFTQQKARYADIMHATRELGGFLEKEDVSRNMLVEKLFEGKNSYNFAKNAKVIIDQDNPKMWDQMCGEYFVKLLNDATPSVANASKANSAVNWGAMTQKWGKMDARQQDMLLEGAGLKKEQLNALFRLGSRFQGATTESLANDPKAAAEAIKGAIVMGAGGGATAKAALIPKFWQNWGKDKAVMRWLQDGGVEQVLNDMPGLDKGYKRQILDSVNNWAPPVNSKLGGMAKGATKGQLRTSTRRRMQEE